MLNTDAEFALELCRSRVSDKLRKELATEKDETLALRKALLALIMMTQDVAGTSAKEFIEYIIQDFPALDRHFSTKNGHPIIGKYTVGRRYLKDQGTVLSLNRKVVESLLGHTMNARELASLGGLIPWPITGERYIGFFDLMGFRAFVDRYQSDHSILHQIMEELGNVAAIAEEIYFKNGNGPDHQVGHRGS